ncbi:MAG: hypothetical protein CVV49_17870 [Spirochaetae bacterium HGW-Spirochaetae-5]|nr:MAG: hypothetical protein CVV49_17870 [Spirochaetae bacterium HGW-Spirochaetae-5]
MLSMNNAISKVNFCDRILSYELLRSSKNIWCILVCFLFSISLVTLLNGCGSSSESSPVLSSGSSPVLSPGLSTSVSQVDTVGIQSVASGLTSPVTMVIPNDNTDRKFIVDQVGKIFVIDADNNLLSTPFLDVSNKLVTLMTTYDERGLLGMAFHPNYSINGRFFIFYNAPKGSDVPADYNSEIHVSEFKVSTNDPNKADPSSENILLTIPKPSFNHNGGTLVFGPDGMLYVSVGDGGASDDVGIGHTPTLGNGQDKSKLLGKILRIDIDSGTPYSIPSDNPFVNDSGAKGEIWAYGFRNPYRMSFDTGGDKRLFVADVGQNLYEEIDIGTSGGNYGWNIKEGKHCFDPNNANTPPATCTNTGIDGQTLLDPIIEYSHKDSLGNNFGIAVLGGYIYRGNAIPALVGNYIFGDLSTNLSTADGSIFAAYEKSASIWEFRQLKISGQSNLRIGRFILGFGQDNNGEIYIMTSQNVGPSGTTGQVYKIIAQ